MSDYMSNNLSHKVWLIFVAKNIRSTRLTNPLPKINLLLRTYVIRQTYREVNFITINSQSRERMNGFYKERAINSGH